MTKWYVLYERILTEAFYVHAFIIEHDLAYIFFLFQRFLSHVPSTCKTQKNVTVLTCALSFVLVCSGIRRSGGKGKKKESITLRGSVGSRFEY